jgi:hypothetical protein
MTIQQFIDATGITLTELSRIAGVNYGHLHACHAQGKPVGAKVARALAAVKGPNGERISVEDAIGAAPTRRARTRSKRAA